MKASEAKRASGSRRKDSAPKSRDKAAGHTAAKRPSARKDSAVRQARSDTSATQVSEIASILRGEAPVGIAGWMSGEMAWSWYSANGVARQMIGRFATLMTKSAHRYTHTDVPDFDWSPTISHLDDLRFRLACRTAAIWAFVFGAGIIEHVVDDGPGRDSSDPLEEDANGQLVNVREYKGVRIHTAHSLRPANGHTWKTAEWFEVTTTGQRRKVHRSRLSIMVTTDTPDGVLHSTISGWPPSWIESIYRDFSDWTNAECDVSAIIHTLSVLHLQLEGWALARENPDSVQAVAVQDRIAQALEGLSAHGVLVTDTNDRLGEVSRNIAGLADVLERKALRAASSAGVTKELVLMEANGNLGLNSAPIDAYYDLIEGWQDMMIGPAVTRASELSLAVQSYKARLVRETLVIPTQFLVVFDPIQQANGKDRADQRKANADARAADATKSGIPLEVILQDQDLREHYSGIDAWLEDKATREEIAKQAAAASGLDNPVGEDMISAAQAARPFGISAGTLIKMAVAGSVPGRKIAGRWKFHLSKVQEVLLGKTPAQIESAVDQRFDALSTASTFGEAWGASEAMREIFAVLERVRDSGLAVLLLGETGTGKEGIARGLHVGDGPFIAINCAALDDDPADAAKQLRRALAAAAGGTLFLDEIGDTPREVQSAMLRVLASPHDARIVSATSLDARDPKVLRPDLYYRLAEVEVEIPPLRDREGDIVEIARRIYSAYTSERGYEAADPPFTEQAIAVMLAYPWPGNIRELKSAVCRAAEMAEQAEPINVEHLGLNMRGER